ncbi:hypothetical protein FF1_025901 [Malus domestica]
MNCLQFRYKPPGSGELICRPKSARGNQPEPLSSAVPARESGPATTSGDCFVCLDAGSDLSAVQGDSRVESG